MSHKLVDSFQRPIGYLRVSVTDQCDLRCLYCIPRGFTGFREPAHWLDFNEITRLARLFAQTGVKHIRLTGGEPLLRKNLPELVACLNAIQGIDTISLSTNALRLKQLASELKQAGLTRLNISLDSLKNERFQAITRGKLCKALAGIEAARLAGFDNTKINMVVMKGINDHEVVPMLQYCLEQNLTLRFIETMPMGSTGRLASRHYLSLRTVRDRIDNHFDLIHELPTPAARYSGPAKYMRINGTSAKVGFITPISEHFCDSCNRVRLGVDGMLYPCLGQNHAVALGQQLRNKATDAELLSQLQQVIQDKPRRHEFVEKPEQVLRFMSTTGG